jgi:PAS domain S-box-containing protein
MKKASNDVFDQFFNSSIDLLCIADTNGNFCKVNSEWERTLGYSASELEGKQFISFVHPDDIEKTIEATGLLAMNKKVMNFINRYRHKDGSYRWIEWRSYPSEGKIYATAHDITGHVETELALKQSEERNALISSLLTDYIFKFDVSEDETLTLIYTSDNFERITGHTRLEAQDYRNWNNIFYPDDYARALRSLKQMISKGVKCEMECRTKARGSEHWISIVAKPETDKLTGKVVTITGAVIDISERKRAEKHLKSSEEKFLKAFMCSPDLVSIVDCSTKKYVDVNEVFINKTGYKRHEVVGKTASELGFWVDMKNKDEMLNLLYKDHKLHNFQTKQRTRSGEIRDCLITAETIEINNEKNFLFFTRDITDEKKSEIALRESEQRLRSFIDKSSEGVVIIDESGIIEEWNNSAESITGIPKNSIIDQNWEDAAILFNPNSGQSAKARGEIKKKVADALKRGLIDLQPYDLQLFHKPSGKLKYLEEKMFTIKTDIGYRLAIIFTDITERRETEELITSERNTLRALVDNIPDITYVKDRNSRFVITNATLARVLNTTVENILGKTDFDFFPADLAQRFFNDEQLLIQTGIPVLDKEEIIFDQQGNRVVLLTTKLPLYDKTGSITGFVGTGHIITERKQYEEAMRKSEDLLKGITQNVPGLVFQFYSEKNGKYGLNFISDRSLEYLGLDNTNLDAVFDGFIAGVVDYDRPRLIRSIEDSISTVSPWKFEGKYIKPDGMERYFRGESQPRILDNMLVFDGFLLDITDSWKAEQELADTRAILATAISQSPIPMVIVSMPDFIIRIANYASCEFLGVKDQSEFVGKCFNDVKQTWLEFDENGHSVPPNEMPLSLALRGIETKGKEYFVIRKDGTIRWESVSSSLVRNDKGMTIAAFLLSPDITERKRAEAVVVEKEAKIRSIFTAAPVAIGLTINREFQECNDMFYKMTGYSPEEIIGKNASMIYPTNEEFLYVGSEQTRQMQEKRIENMESRWLCKDGRIISILLRFVPLDVNDFKKGVTFTALDISERKEAEAEIIMLNEQLEKKVQERTLKLNEAISDLEAFSYSVSHDLRAPIRHIDGFVKLLYSKIPDPTDSIVNYYNKIEAASQRMSSMIDSLLSFSRVGRRQLTIMDVDLDSLVYEIIDHFSPDIEKRNITWNISHLPNLNCDKNLIKLVFENLIANAIKYTSKREEAIIELGSVKRSENQIELYIKDNGVGFDMAHAGKLFGVFQRLHSTEDFEGIGIGLANVKQIIEKHKGSVRAEGKINEGAVFYINLPKK